MQHCQRGRQQAVARHDLRQEPAGRSARRARTAQAAAAAASAAPRPHPHMQPASLRLHAHQPPGHNPCAPPGPPPGHAPGWPASRRRPRPARAAAAWRRGCCRSGQTRRPGRQNIRPQTPAGPPRPRPWRWLAVGLRRGPVALLSGDSSTPGERGAPASRAAAGQQARGGGSEGPPRPPAGWLGLQGRGVTPHPTTPCGRSSCCRHAPPWAPAPRPLGAQASAASRLRTLRATRSVRHDSAHRARAVPCCGRERQGRRGECARWWVPGTACSSTPSRSRQAQQSIRPAPALGTHV